ncbi:MAG: anti-sigma factor [Gaiellaceae bacterium]
MSDIDIERDESELFTRLEAVLPRAAPPEDMFDRILAEVQPEATVVPLRPKRDWASGWTIGAVVTAAAVLVLSIGVVLRDAPESPAARATLEAKTDAGVTGEAALFAPDSDSGRLELALRSVPASPAGHHYEVWVLPEGSDEMISVGTFHAETTRDISLDFELPGSGSFAAVDVSVEEDDGPEEHSDTSLATGFFS